MHPTEAHIRQSPPKTLALEVREPGSIRKFGIVRKMENGEWQTTNIY